MRPPYGLISVAITAILLLFPPEASLRANDAAAPKKSKVPRIAAEDAGAHVGQECTVEMTVRTSRFLKGPGICFLNSCKNYRDAKNFTVVIMERGLAALKASALSHDHADRFPRPTDDAVQSDSKTASKRIDKPADHYRGKKIRVTGRIELYQSRPQIVVERAEQIAIVKPKKKAGAAKEKKDAPSRGDGDPSR